MAEWPYGTRRWQRLRAMKLASQPLCEPCEMRGHVVRASVVDHCVSVASGGDPFPYLEGLMSMCPSCHATKTGAKDRHGPDSDGSGLAFKGCGLDGLPIDPEHPFRDRGVQRPAVGE